MLLYFLVRRGFRDSGTLHRARMCFPMYCIISIFNNVPACIRGRISLVSLPTRWSEVLRTLCTGIGLGPVGGGRLAVSAAALSRDENIRSVCSYAPVPVVQRIVRWILHQHDIFIVAAFDTNFFVWTWRLVDVVWTTGVSRSGAMAPSPRTRVLATTGQFCCLFHIVNQL